MTYQQIYETVKEFQREDELFLFKAQIADEVRAHIEDEYIGEHFEELCRAIYTLYMDADCGVDISDMCFYINEHYDPDYYESILDEDLLEECSKEASYYRD